MTNVLHDLKNDLDDTRSHLWDELVQRAEDARPAASGMLSDVRDRGAAAGATVVSHLPANVIDRLPDAVSDRLPGTTSKGSRMKKLLLVGGVLGLAAAAVAWMRGRTPAPAPYAASNRPTPGPSANGTGPTTAVDEALDLPVNDGRP